MKHVLVIVPIVLAAACCSPVQADQKIDAYQRDLLELAWFGVSKMPLNPHIKNRSRAQMKIVDAALTLKQPRLAESWLQDIANWQRCLGYASVAAFYAENNQSDLADEALAKSEAMLTMAEGIRDGDVVATTVNPLIDSLTDWRYQSAKAKAVEVRDALNAARPESTMDGLRTMASSENFEIIHAAQLEMIELADRDYASLSLSEWIQAELEPGLEKMPVFLKLDVLGKLAGVCIGHEDSANALSLAERLDAMIEKAGLPPRLHIPEKARVIALRCEAGSRDAALEQLDSLLQFYNTRQEFIVNIERAQLLCTLAETYNQFGSTAKALELYGLAVDAGQINPNSRPQADDLCRICCSMALHRVEPSAGLLQKLEKMKNELGSPW